MRNRKNLTILSSGSVSLQSSSWIASEEYFYDSCFFWINFRFFLASFIFTVSHFLLLMLMLMLLVLLPMLFNQLSARKSSQGPKLTPSKRKVFPKGLKSRLVMRSGMIAVVDFADHGA